MPILRRTTGCRECPFRRISTPGWLGENEPQQFEDETQREADMPCHMSIDYSDPDWLHKQYPESDHCAGSLIYLRNQLKLPRRPDLAEKVRAVERDTVNYFEWHTEFLSHHLGREVDEFGKPIEAEGCN